MDGHASLGPVAGDRPGRGRRCADAGPRRWPRRSTATRLACWGPRSMRRTRAAFRSCSRSSPPPSRCPFRRIPTRPRRGRASQPGPTSTRTPSPNCSSPWRGSTRSVASATRTSPPPFSTVSAFAALAPVVSTLRSETPVGRPTSPGDGAAARPMAGRRTGQPGRGRDKGGPFRVCRRVDVRR